eukprot:TRINITY_DN67930_c2_g3_i1.p1 TRINITY_DN67930_c2_g3~~TRINITY_DN67930_c2_g3_i1.p1  ORF type:complete len:217 (-),score=25.94 TRINITY_DN67930_c2_g3_i1:144-794(-)
MVEVSDTLQLILEFLEPPSLCTCSTVSQQWHEASGTSFDSFAVRIIKGKAAQFGCQYMEALKALQALKACDLVELRQTYPRNQEPPPLIKAVFDGVQILLRKGGADLSGEGIMRYTANPEFMSSLLGFKPTALADSEHKQWRTALQHHVAAQKDLPLKQLHDYRIPKVVPLLHSWVLACNEVATGCVLLSQASSFLEQKQRQAHTKKGDGFSAWLM